MIQIEQDFIVDKLTDSFLNTISGDSFETQVGILKQTDIDKLSGETGWNFNWRTEFESLEKEVYKLSIVNNSDIIQGLVSLTVEPDHVFMSLLESAPFNVGQN